MKNHIMIDSTSNINLPTDEWWSKKRLLYNAGLVIAGLLAFTIFVIAIKSAPPDTQFYDSILVTIIGNGLIYLIGMGLANLFYYLGPISEKAIKPINKKRFRKTVFGLGFWFSFLLPLIVPSLFLFSSL